MAERSYEVYCNVCDALDELRVIQNGPPQPPRYRACLNVLRCIGDAFQLVDALENVIRRNPKDESPGEEAAATLDEILECKIVFGDRRGQRRDAITYRNMLVHHGRPWLHFRSEEFEGYPYVLKPEYCWHIKPRGTREIVTWAKQIEMFKETKHQDKFILLFKACEEVCNWAIIWIDKEYCHIVSTLDQVLTVPSRFVKYRRQWGTSK